MTNVIVRPARTGELAAVAALRWHWVREVHGPPATDRSSFVAAFLRWAERHAPSHRCFVAVREEAAVGEEAVLGMAWLAVTARVPFPGSMDRLTGDLQCAYVVPRERNLGLGGRLVEAVVEHARGLGLERVTVHSSERAVTAYARYGFASSPLLRHLHLSA